jgi:hypothetical protein
MVHSELATSSTSVQWLQQQPLPVHPPLCLVIRLGRIFLTINKAIKSRLSKQVYQLQLEIPRVRP